MVIIELESLNLTQECLLSIKYGFSNLRIDSIFVHMFRILILIPIFGLELPNLKKVDL